jgi:hypothetical protein
VSVRSSERGSVILDEFLYCVELRENDRLVGHAAPFAVDAHLGTVDPCDDCCCSVIRV